jgi:hypothetical protein
MPTTYTMANQMLSVMQNKPALYLGLFTAPPGRDGAGGAEIDGHGYARQPIAFGNPIQGEMTNVNAIQFSQAAEDWGTVTSLGIFDAQAGGNLLWFDDFSQSLNVAAGAFFMLRISDLTLVEGSCPIDHQAAV